MTNAKSTKRALFTSAFAILICVAMLIGTTFAWFTDTASTGVNKITAGNLDVALEMYENGEWVSAEGKTLQFKTADNRTTDILWEPGCRYELPELRVVNNGNLALKYKLAVTGIDGDAKLNEVIDWTIGDVAIDSTEHTLKANEQGTPFTIKGVMKTTAGNEYQGLSIDGIAITVYATQATVEHDSFDNQYDADAAYKGTQEFTDGTYTLNKGGVALNPDEAAVKASGEGTNLTITGGFYDGGKGGNNKCIDVSNGATVTIKDGTFTVGGDANGDGNSVVYSYNGNVIIEGGFFYTNYSWNGFYYVLNQNNSNPGTITVKGGTFVNYDPSKGDDNLGGNFIADGYSVVSEKQANGDVWYTVVKGNVTTLTPDTVNTPGIYHSDGTFYLSAGDYGKFTATLEQSYKNVTFLASENAKFKEVTIRYHGGDPADATISAKGDSTLTVKGFHVSGNISISSFDKNVTVEDNDAASIALKTYHVADMDVQFLNNELGVGTAGNGYGIYFVPNTTNYDLTITGNTFTGTGSHAIAVQGNGDGKAETAAKNITVKGNTFNSYGMNGKSGRAAFKIWEDTKLAPNNKADVNEAAKALAKSVKENNTFSGSLAGNCVVADFYGKSVAFN